MVGTDCITHDGSLPDPLFREGLPVIFPSAETGRNLPTGVPFMEVANLLQKRNRIAAEGAYFSVVRRGDAKPEEGLTIGVRRTPDQPANLQFLLARETVLALRRLSWGEFREIQAQFEEWLVRKAQGRELRRVNFGRGSGSSFGGFRADVERLFHCGPCIGEESGKGPLAETGIPGNCFEGSLKSFWLEVLRGGDFRSFAARYLGPLPNIAPDHERQALGDIGPRFGAIPLQEGMRLAIHWGGTAIYEFENKKIISRQTTAGTSFVEIMKEGDGVQLAHLRSWADRTGKAFALEARAPHSASPPDSPLPFGPGLNTNSAHMVPVQAHIDLFNRACFQPSEKPYDEPRVPEHLTLLIPSMYVKADSFGQKDGSSMANTSGTHDAFASGEARLATADLDEQDEALKHERHALEMRLGEIRAQIAAIEGLQDPNEMARAVALVEIAKLQALLKRLEDPEAMRDLEKREADLRQRKSDAMTTPTGNWISALSRRFILFPSRYAYRDPYKHAPHISSNGSKPDWNKNWALRPMVFGNQTTVEVELMIRVAPGQAEWVPFNDSWGRLARTRAAGAFTRNTGSDAPPSLAVTRFNPATRRGGAPSARTFRFHTSSPGALEEIRVHPGDTFNHSP